MEKILKDIEIIAREVFDDKFLTITEKSGPDDIEAWDSLTYIQLLSSLENKFGIKFSLDEMLKNSTIGDIAGSILSKTS